MILKLSAAALLALAALPFTVCHLVDGLGPHRPRGAAFDPFASVSLEPLLPASLF
jgi:hypothetical protein